LLIAFTFFRLEKEGMLV